MDNLLRDLNTVEEDSKQIESIDRLQKAFNDVKNSYAIEYNNTLEHLITPIKDKLKNNEQMSTVVNNYVQNYVKEGSEENAKEELYNILAAELLQTMQTISHTTCVIC